MLVETIIQIKVKPYNLSPTIGSHFLPVFYIYIYSCRWKQFFRRSENVFFNESFIPAGEIKIFV